MPAGKTSTLTFRIAPALKDALRTVAEREHRSIANMVEMMIRDYCGRNAIAIPGQGGPSRSQAVAKSKGNDKV